MVSIDSISFTWLVSEARITLKIVAQTKLTARQKEIVMLSVFTSSFKPAREIRRFHVAVVQRRLRNVQKKVYDSRAKLLFC